MVTSSPNGLLTGSMGDIGGCAGDQYSDKKITAN